MGLSHSSVSPAGPSRKDGERSTRPSDSSRPDMLRSDGETGGVVDDIVPLRRPRGRTPRRPSLCPRGLLSSLSLSLSGERLFSKTVRSLVSPQAAYPGLACCPRGVAARPRLLPSICLRPRPLRSPGRVMGGRTLGEPRPKGSCCS